ncbi:hypothetical protein AB0M54_11240 [Actinoplanes sp. NPDC051470]|uniref:hypothetical protein n=1 Tax=unclassified Actinoplanes TaxID=2626549 RepID=UPI003433BBD3
MRKAVVGVVALLVPVLLSGCAALGFDMSMKPNTEASDSAGGPVSDAGWIVGETGKATPSPTPTVGNGKYAGASLPPVSFPPRDPSCPRARTAEPVLIPMTITPGAGSLTVSWPRQRASNYRITAVPQPLRSGKQPDPVWQDVAPAGGCTVTATISGLKKGLPYVVWLDAPASGYWKDGTRHTYAGESGVVYPN